MVPVKRNLLPIADQIKIENAEATAEQNALNVEDIMTAIVELGDLFATQDDAIVELAEIISEGE